MKNVKNKILLIDDEVEILNVYEKILNTQEELSAESLDFLDEDLSVAAESSHFDLEYETLRAESGEQGIELVRDNPDIKVAFIDMRMPPGMNGAQAAKAIREINPKIEIVIATAYSDINLHEIVEIIGKPEKILYLRKPFATEEIEQMALNLVTKYNNARIKDRFMANVSHEMKTPLSVISGYAQILQETVENEDDREYVRSIISGSRQLGELIDSLLLMTEISHNKDLTIESQVNLSDVVEELKKTSFILSKRYPDIEFNIDVETEDVSIKAPKRHLVYAISNIIDNAFKFTRKGNVNLGIKRNDNQVEITVADNGEGIPSDKVALVYDKFYRVEDTVHTDVGFGLGLSNTHEIVSKLKGSISITSVKDEGTQVSVLLPV
jgi:signal transduction histidine kinase